MMNVIAGSSVDWRIYLPSNPSGSHSLTPRVSPPASPRREARRKTETRFVTFVYSGERKDSVYCEEASL